MGLLSPRHLILFDFYFKAACPKGYSKVPQGSRSCFKVNTTPLTWDDSIYGCALDNGSLASLQSKEEADLVVSLIRG